MVIVSQDKTQIFNFDNINYLQMGKNLDNDFAVEINYSDCNYNVIARYKTEERAQKVLQEIIQTKSNFEYYKYIDESIRDKVDSLMKTKYNFFDTYEMPEE